MSGNPPATASFAMASEVSKGTPALVVEKVEKRFGDFAAVRGVSFEVQPGEFVSLLGPSGSGKTTILRLIGGLEFPTAGRIALNGTDIQHQPSYRRNIGVVFQKYALFPHMTAAQNVEFPLKRRGVPERERRERVAAALDMVRLGALGKRYPHELSGGQEQRVALARAVVFQPDVLLLDEPLGALDKQLRDQMQHEIRSLQRELRMTTIFVTHDQAEAMAMSDRIAVVNGGLIEQIDTPEGLYERPASEFVAGFVGDSNLLRCEVLEVQQGYSTVRLEGGVVVRAACAQRLGGPALLLVRPERVVLAPEAPEKYANVIEGRVLTRIYLGDVVVFTIACGAMTLTVRLAFGTGGMQAKPGSAVQVAWQPADCTLVEAHEETS
jgi:putative spermidine/putrescine transport system ATP-binding protein